MRARRHLFVAVSLLDAAAAAVEDAGGANEAEGRRLRELAISHLRRAVKCDATLHQARMELCLALEEARDLAGERARADAMRCAARSSISRLGSTPPPTPPPGARATAFDAVDEGAGPWLDSWQRPGTMWPGLDSKVVWGHGG